VKEQPDEFAVVTKAPLIVPPETDALALLIKRSLQETQAPNDPATTQSVPAVTPRLASRVSAP